MPVHVREAGSGQNAIEACFPIIKALRKLEEGWNAEKSNFKYYKDTEHPINFNVGKIKGGDWASSALGVSLTVGLQFFLIGTQRRNH